MNLISDTHVDPRLTAVFTKWNLFHNFRLVYGTYVTLRAAWLAVYMTQIIENFMLKLVYHAIEIAMFVALAILFRCRHFRHDFEVVYRNGRTPDAQFVHLGPLGVSSARVVPFLGAQVRTLSRYMSRKQGRVVVVLHPDEDCDVGTPRIGMIPTPNTNHPDSAHSTARLVNINN